MKCNKCGAKNNKNAKFCHSCGEAIEKKNKPKSKLLLGIIIIICILITIGGISAYIIYYDNSPVEILQLNKNNPGNVLENQEIKSNIPNSEIVSQICEDAKEGVPIYKIGDGSEPVSIIIAGVHGDQLSSQIAALKIIDYLDGRKITGTVYVIPFAAPGATQDNSKLSENVNLNIVANETGTTSNDIVKFAKNNNATAVGDFHGTELGKNPGKTTIMCSKYPTYGSFELAKRMSLLSGEKVMQYTVAGIAYEGAIEDICNLDGTPAVTPLVLSTHGKVNEVSVEESYIQMISLLLANGNINDDQYNKFANLDIDGF